MFGLGPNSRTFVDLLPAAAVLDNSTPPADIGTIKRITPSSTMPSTDTNVHRAGLANPNLFLSARGKACFVLIFEKEKTLQYIDFRVSGGLESYLMHCKKLPRSPLDKRTKMRFPTGLTYLLCGSCVLSRAFPTLPSSKKSCHPPLKIPSDVRFLTCLDFHAITVLIVTNSRLACGIRLETGAVTKEAELPAEFRQKLPSGLNPRAWTLTFLMENHQQTNRHVLPTQANRPGLATITVLESVDRCALFVLSCRLGPSSEYGVLLQARLPGTSLVPRETLCPPNVQPYNFAALAELRDVLFSVSAAGAAARAS